MVKRSIQSQEEMGRKRRFARDLEDGMIGAKNDKVVKTCGKKFFKMTVKNSQGQTMAPAKLMSVKRQKISS